MSGSSPAKNSARASSNAATIPAMGSDEEADAERLGELLGALEALGRGVDDGRATPVTRSGAERVGGDRRRERGVDAAGQAEDDAGEAVLADVVAQAGAERGPDLGLVVEDLGDPRLRQRGARAVATPAGGSRADRLAAPACRQAAAERLAQAAADGHRGVDVGQQQVLVELGRPGDDLAGGVEHGGAAVEHQLVLAADLVAEGERGGAVVGPGGEHPLPPVALARW